MLSSSIPFLTIYQTVKYDQFKIDENNNNRDVYESNIKAIKASIKQIGDKGGNFPIVVGAVDEDGKAPIIDGQHRFNVRKTLKLPIYYIQSLDLTPEDTAFINKAMKKWTNKDFAKLAQGKPLMVLANSILTQLPKKLQHLSYLGVLFNPLKSSTKVITVGEYDVEYKKLEQLSSNIIMYSKIMESNITDFEQSSNTMAYIALAVKKLLSKKVLPSEIIKGTYNEVMANLYAKNLIK